MTANRVLSPASYRRMPWRNGGGVTTEIVVHPPGSGFASFSWRASLADVSRDGPFSAFPGVDRILVLLSGRGVRLAGSAFSAELRRPFDIVRFDGDAAVDCELVDGPVRDFNLMLRRDRARGSVTVVRGDRVRALSGVQAVLCHAAAGACRCSSGGAPVVLRQGDTLWLETPPDASTLRVEADSPEGVALVATIEAA
jgi:environmental stress-induced protein Ves